MGFHYIRRYFHQKSGNTFPIRPEKNGGKSLATGKTSPSHPILVWNFSNGVFARSAFSSTTVQSQYMSVGCQAVDTLDCVTTSVACKSTAANLQTTIQMFPTARRDCENEGDLESQGDFNV